MDRRPAPRDADSTRRLSPLPRLEGDACPPTIPGSAAEGPGGAAGEPVRVVVVVADSGAGPARPEDAAPAHEGPFGRFEAQAVLGQGGMARVWLAKDPSLRREVAIKSLSLEGDEARAEFIAEAQVAGQLEHPNVVPVHELGFDGEGRPYLVMKRVRGRTLASVLAALAAGRTSGLFTPEETLLLGADTGEPDTGEPDAAGAPDAAATSHPLAATFAEGTAGAGADAALAARAAAPTDRAGALAGGDARAGHDDPSRAAREHRPPLAPRRAAQVLTRLLGVYLKVCDAIAYAHARGVVHRDLKPSNILIGRFGEVLVTDWGLAKVLRPREGAEGAEGDAAAGGSPAAAAARSPAGGAAGGSARPRAEPGAPAPADPPLATGEPDPDEPPPPITTARAEGGSPPTAHGTVKGTLAYMAPEQARGDVAAIDARTDVYSLGALLYEMLTFELPVSGPPAKALARVAAGDIPKPSERAPDRFIPRELEAIVVQAMRRDPAERYPSVAELKNDVEAYLADRAVGAHRYSWVERAGKWARRHRGRLALGGAGLALVLAASSLAPLIARRARTEERARQAAERARMLDDREAAVAAAQASLAAAERLLESDPEGALAAALRVSAEHGARLARIAADPLVEAGRPALGARARALPARAEALRRGALAAAARLALAGAEDPARPWSERARLAEEAYRRFAPLAPDSDPAEPLPVAGLALARARLALARLPRARRAPTVPSAEPPPGSPRAEAARWVANAYAAEPRSEAAGRAFLLLAEHAMREGRVGEAIEQHHLALSGFGGEQRALRPWALYGLAEALANAPLDLAEAPFAPGVAPRVLGLRALLEVVTPTGALRPEVAAGLPEAEGARLERAARRLLFVLRRIAVPAFDRAVEPLDADGDGVAERVASWRGTRFTVYAPGAPAAPGAGPLTLEAIVEKDLAPAITRAAPALAAASPRTIWLDLEAGARGVLLVYEGRMLGFRTLDDDRPCLDAPLPGDLDHDEAADLDGDGRRDLVLGFGLATRAARVLYQEADGRFGEPRPLRTVDPAWPAPLRREASRSSEVLGLEVRDLDGDGAVEVLVSLGAWDHFSLEVWRPLPDRTFRLVCYRRVGRASFELYDPPEGGPPLIIVRAGLDERERRFFAIRDEPEPALGVSALRFEGGALVPAALPDAFREVEGRPQRIDPLSLGGRRLALLGGALRGSTVVRFLDEEPERDGAMPEVHLLGEVIEAVSGGALWRGHRVYRALDDADLAALAAAPVPLEPLPEEPVEAVRVTAFLERFGLAAEAVRLAQEALASGVPEPAATDLRRFVLRGLAERGRDAELAAELEALAPTDALVQEVIVAAEQAYWRLRAHARGARLYATWSASQRVSAHSRRLLAAASERLAEGARLMGPPAVAWSLAGIDFDARAAPPAAAGTRPLALAVVAGDLAAVAIERDPAALAPGAEAVLRVRSARRDGAPRETAREPPERAALVGVPVRVGPGSWRVTAEVALDRTAWGSEVALGLAPLAALWRAGPPELAGGCSIRVYGGNDLYGLELRGVPWIEWSPGARLDRWLGRWLRVDIHYEAARRELLVEVEDLETGERIGRERRLGLPPGASGMGLGVLGLAPSGYPTAAEARIARVAAHGAVTLVAPDDPELLAVLAVAPDVRHATEVLRALLAGDDARAAALSAARAEALEAAAGPRLDGSAARHPGEGPEVEPPATPAGDPARRRARALRDGALEARLLAAERAEGARADAIAAALAPHAVDRSDADALAAALFARPLGAVPAASVEAVGALVARARGLAADPRRAVAALEDAMARARREDERRRREDTPPLPGTEPLLAAADVALAAWASAALAARAPDSEEDAQASVAAEALEVRVLSWAAREAQAAGAERYLALEALRLRLLDRAGAPAGAPAGPEAIEVTRARGLAAFHFLRRAEGIAILDPIEPALDRRDRALLDLQRRLDAGSPRP